MPDFSPPTGRTGPLTRDLLVGVGLLLVLGAVYWLDVSRVPWFVYGSTQGSTQGTVLEASTAGAAQAAPAAIQGGNSVSGPQEVAGQAPANRDLAAQQQKPAPVDIPAKSGEPPPENPAPLFAGTRAVVPVFRNERPPQKPEQKVEFFEVKSAAQTMAFVVDCSYSMAGGRFDRARLELAHSISKLQSDQGVYVIFFSDGPVPLPSEQIDKPALVMASAWVKYEIAKRLSTMFPFGGTNPEPSLKIAASLNPDVIFLLSDGDFSPLSAETQADLQKRNIKVHTIAFESPEGSRLLEQIAQRTGGTFRFVPQSDAALNPERVRAEIAGHLIEELRAVADAERDRIRRALVELAGGKDFGPKAGAKDLDRAIARWQAWYRELLAAGFRNTSQADLVQLIRTGAPHERCAALIAARTRKLNIPEELVSAVGDADPAISQEARQALIQLADHCDYGPAENASEAERALAAAKWRRWLDCQAIIRELSRAAQPALLAAFSDADASRRWAAVSVARQKKQNVHSSLLGSLLTAVEDSDEDVRSDASRALAALIPRGDLGPALGKERGKERGRHIPDGLIGLLSHERPEVRLSADGALAELARADDQTWSRTWEPGAEDSQARWTEWWNALKDRQAAKQFQLAEQLFDEGKKEPAERRFREIIDKYPGTKTAQKAERLLRKKEE